MYDFLGLRIHFKDDFYTHELKGDEVFSSVDIVELARRGLRLAAGSVDVAENGEASMNDLHHPWSSIPSSYTGIAFKFYQSSGFRNLACIELKASPAKVVQGHNVYGSDRLHTCATYILEAIKRAMPQLCEVLDFNLIDVFRFDCTYSVQVNSRDTLMAALKALTQVSHKYLRPARHGEFESTLYFNDAKPQKGKPKTTGRTTSLCIYSKLDEVQFQLDDLRQKAKKERTDRYNRVIDELSSERLTDFAKNRLRFEARFKTRWFIKNNIPQNLWDFIAYAEAYELSSEQSFCLFAWHDAMKDLLSAVEGQKLDVIHDHKVRTLLHDMYDTFDDKGNRRTSKALRLFSVYDRLKSSGWNKVKDTMTKSTFYRAIRELEAIGFSHAELQNLDNTESVPLGEVLTFDFNNQRPDYYQEPSVGELTSTKALREYLSGQSHFDTSFDSTRFIQDKLADLGLPPFYVRALQAGREVRINQDKSLSLVIWRDGTCDLVHHEPGNKESVIDSVPKTPTLPIEKRMSFQSWSTGN
ncbi:TPA: phage/plasmid replication protein, II/X family [Vibrio vulnificus]